MTTPAATTTPTAIPALAPVPRPASAFWGTADTPVPVGTVVVSTHLAPPLMNVQACVLAQQPPPRLEAHATWLVVHPAGTSDTSALELAALVERQRLLTPQTWP